MVYWDKLGECGLELKFHIVKGDQKSRVTKITQTYSEHVWCIRLWAHTRAHTPQWYRKTDMVVFIALVTYGYYCMLSNDTLGDCLVWPCHDAHKITVQLPPCCCLWNELTTQFRKPYWMGKLNFSTISCVFHESCCTWVLNTNALRSQVWCDCNGAVLMLQGSE